MSTTPLDVQRHSVAHLVAAAVASLFQDVQFGVGPVLENGAYYDFVLPRPIVPEDLEKIEQAYQALLKRNLRFVRRELPIQEAVTSFTNAKQPLKAELLSDLQQYGTTRLDEESRAAVEGETETVSIYDIIDEDTKEVIFSDLCRGPHVESVEELRSLGVKIDKFSAAYWRGDQERNISMQRVYALIFSSPEDLAAFITRREEAIKRDHRTLGRELELFFFHETAPGVAYWLPKGLAIKNLLVQYWRDYHNAQGYQEIASPLINKKELWETSGHWQHYKDDIFVTQSKNDETWALKPMNCPNAMVCFGFKPRSYRDLPLRFSDTDILHRDEIAGALHGLMRARSFSQDDSHNFVMESQIKSEIEAILQIAKDFYGIFGLADKVQLKLSTRPDEFMGDIETWNKAEADLKEVLDASGFTYGIKEKDGAFYGPKIDIHFEDAIGREWQCGTIQLDFQLPRNFNLQYTAEDGSLQTPVVIHRAIYGSLERFIGIVIEHFGGRLPFWFAPCQVKVLTLNDDMANYAQKVADALTTVVLSKPVENNPVRFEMDERRESLGRKIRDAETQKVPVILIVGPKDEAAGEVSVRTHEGESKVPLSELAEFLRKFA
jgi:threonyl-tRNA synthetase